MHRQRGILDLGDFVEANKRHTGKRSLDVYKNKYDASMAFAHNLKNYA
jgi:hypothetical protein